MNKRYADIIVDISHEKLDRTFQYVIPTELRDKVNVGSRVRIPFGSGNRMINGYVIQITDEPKYDVNKMKQVAGIEDKGIAIESHQIVLAAWIRKNYGSTMNQALKTVIPVKQKMKHKKSRQVSLKVDKEEAEEILLEFERKHYTARARALEAILKETSLDYSLLVRELHISPSVIRGLEEKGILSVSSTDVYRNPISSMEMEEMPQKLTRAQQEAVEGIQREWEAKFPRPCLLFGVTGSGKTQVYMELIDSMIKEGKQAIVLIPEIALTYQTVKRFYKKFGERVSVINSRLSQGERYDQFERAKNGEIQVMIGPRSALFTPFPRLGLIIMDEEHESSYKSETMPRYHAREIGRAHV